MKTKRNIIIFAAIIAILLGAYILIPRLEAEKDEEPTQSAIEIFKVEKDKIAELSLQNSGESFTFVRKDNRWLLKEREDMELEQGKVDSLAYDAAVINADAVVDENPAQLSAFGLDEPQGTLSLLLSDGTEKTFFIGDLTPAQSHYYFKDKDKSAVYTVFESKGDSFLRRLGEFRQKNIISLEKNDIRRIELLPAGGQKLVFEGVQTSAEGDDEVVITWDMTAPFPREISRERFDSAVLIPISQIMADEAVDEGLGSLSKYALDKNYSSVIITDKNGAVHSLKIGSVGGNTYVLKNGAPPVWSVAAAKLDFLNINPTDVIIRLIAAVNLNELENAQITAAGETTTLSARRDETRQIFLINGKLTDEGDFRAFYQELAGLFFDNILKTAPPKGDAAVTIKYTLSDERVKTLEFLDYDNLNYAVLEDGQALYTAKKKVVAIMLEKLAELEDGAQAAQ